MNKKGYNIRIVSEKFGEMLNETFVDSIQFKLFLKMVHGCVELKQDLTFFNGDTFFVHIPCKNLVESIILTSTKDMDMVEPIKSKIEALVTK